MFSVRMEKENGIIVPKEIRADLSFDVSACVDRARTSALDVFMREVMESSTFMKSE